MIRDDANKNVMIDALNNVAISFNSKIKQKLATLNSSLAMKSAYVHIYHVIEKAVQNPKQYG